MTKHLHRLAHYLQKSLRQCAGSPPPKSWIKYALRVQLDAWASLYAWHAAGEPVTRITEEQEDALLEALPPELPLATAPLRRSAVAISLPGRVDWIVVARHQPTQVITVHGEQCWSYSQPTLTYVANDGTGIAAGYIGLSDQPTPQHLRLLPGTCIRADGRVDQLTEAEISDADYRLALAIATLYRAS